MALTKEQIENNKKLIRETERLIQKACPKYKLSDKQVEKMAKDEHRMNAYQSANKGSASIKNGFVKTSKKYASFKEGNVFSRLFLNYANVEGTVEELSEKNEKNESRKKQNILVKLKFNQPGAEGAKYRREIVAKAFEDILNAKPSDFIFKKGEVFKGDLEKRKLAAWIIEDQVFKKIKRGELEFKVDPALMEKVNQKRDELFGLALLYTREADKYATKHGAYIDFEQLDANDLENLEAEYNSKPEYTQLYTAIFSEKACRESKQHGGVKNELSEKEYKQQLKIEKQLQKVKVDINDLKFFNLTPYTYYSDEGSKLGDQHRVAEEIVKRIESGQITIPYEEAMYDFPQYEKLFAEEKKNALGQDIEKIKKRLEAQNLSENEREVLMLELQAKQTLFDNVLNTKSDIDYKALVVKYYDDATFEKVKNAVNTIGVINDIRNSKDQNNLTKENVERLVKIHNEYVEQYGDYETMSPDRCLRIASGEFVNTPPAISEWYTSLKVYLRDGNSKFVFPAENDNLAIQELYEKSKKKELIIDGDDPNNFTLVSLNEKGKFLTTSTKTVSKQSPEFGTIVDIAMARAKDQRRKRHPGEPDLPEVTKEQYEENVKKIRDSEKLIRKYCKTYKLSDFEVEMMARDPERQRVSSQCKNVLSDRKGNKCLSGTVSPYTGRIFGRITPARVNTERPFKDYIIKNDANKKVDEENFEMDTMYHRPGKVGDEYRRNEVINIFKEMMQYKPSDFMHKEGDMLCDMTPRKRMMADLITETEFINDIKKGLASVDVDPELLDQIDKYRNMLMDRASLEITLNDVYETKFGAYIDFSKLSQEDVDNLSTDLLLVDAAKYPETERISDRGELETAIKRYGSYLLFKSILKPCVVSSEEFEKQKKSDEELKPVIVDEKKFKQISDAGTIRYNQAEEDLDLFAIKMAELDENGGIEIPYMNKKFTYVEAMKNREQIIKNLNRKSFEKLAEELYALDVELKNEQLDANERKIKEMEFEAKGEVLRLVNSTRTGGDKGKDEDLAVHYKDKTYLELQKNLCIASSINDLRKEIKRTGQGELTPERIKEVAERRFKFCKGEKGRSNLTPSKVYRIINGEQAHIHEVQRWFEDFKKHLKEKGIDINNKMDLMKIKTCTIPDFAHNADLRSGELKYPCSNISIEPTKEQLDEYNRLNDITNAFGKELYDTAKLLRDALNKGNIEEASKIKANYDKQVVDAKKAQLEFSKFKAETFGKFQEDLANSMTFPQDDDFVKMEMLFEAAQKRELFIEDDPLKEGEYHIIYTSGDNLFQATPVANKVGEGHPMQVSFMNLDKAKSFGTAFNGKIYDEKFCIDRTVIGNTIRAQKENMVSLQDKSLKFNKGELAKFIYADEEEALDHDAKRFTKKLKDVKIAAKMLKISDALQYQSKKIESLKEAVGNTSVKAVVSMLNKETLHYTAANNLLSCAIALNAGKPFDEKAVDGMQRDLAILCIMREYKVGKPEKYATVPVSEIIDNAAKLQNYKGFKEACNGMTAEELLGIIHGTSAKAFSRKIYENIKKLDNIEKPAEAVKVEENKVAFEEQKPMMPFI